MNGWQPPVPRTEVGSVEGEYVNLGSHYGHPAIRLRERKTGTDVWCWVSEDDLERFSECVKAVDVWLHKRVRVGGKILYDHDGEILHVEAHEVQLTDVPRVRLDEVRDPNFTGGLGVSEYLNRLREGSLD